MTGTAVIDASVGISLIVKGQATAASNSFEFDNWDLIAPPLFKIEIRHTLLKLERRKLLPASSADLELLAVERQIKFVNELADSDIDEVMHMARVFVLGFYDASYLHLAAMENASLMSRDGPMIDAAKRAGIQVFDLR